MNNSSKTFKIALAGFSCECCTGSPLQTRESDFQLFQGQSLVAQYPFLDDYSDCHFIPLKRVRALPGGSIDPDFYDRFKKTLCDALQDHGSWDGVFLHMHGAAHATGRFDLEGDLIAAIRTIVGPGCLISASYDLHGNVSPAVAENLDILTAYRTAPHIDWFETIQRAMRLLVTCLRNRWKPCISFLPVPIYLSGEQSSTEHEPAKSLYASIPDIIAEYHLLDASILIGYVWADEPRVSASVIAIACDTAHADAAANHLAASFWSQRNNFGFNVRHGEIDQCIHWAMEATEHPVVISDSGDNPTAGGVGDNARVLERLLALNCDNVLVAGIADAPAVDACFAAGEGQWLTVSIGATLDTVHGHPISVSGTVVSLRTQRLRVSSHTHQVNRIAVLKVSQSPDSIGIDIVVTQRRTPFHHLADLTVLDLDPESYHFVVVKMGYLVPEIADLATESILALSPGAVKQKRRFNR